MVILGIDPGLAIVGWGVVDYAGARFRTLGYGSIETPAGMDTPQRLLTIRRGMNALLKKYRPEKMAIEELFFTKNITTGIRVAEARGIILLAGAEAGVPMAKRTVCVWRNIRRCRSSRQWSATVWRKSIRLLPW